MHFIKPIEHSLRRNNCRRIAVVIFFRAMNATSPLLALLPSFLGVAVCRTVPDRNILISAKATFAR
jgi:hypothetical protein